MGRAWYGKEDVGRRGASKLLTKGNQGATMSGKQKSPRKEIFFSNSRVRYTARKSSIMKIFVPMYFMSLLSSITEDIIRGGVDGLVG